MLFARCHVSLPTDNAVPQRAKYANTIAEGPFDETTVSEIGELPPPVLSDPHNYAIRGCITQKALKSEASDGWKRLAQVGSPTCYYWGCEMRTSAPSTVRTKLAARRG